MQKWICSVCGYIYDPLENDNIPFEDLSPSWICPVCSASKDMFKRYKR